MDRFDKPHGRFQRICGHTFDASRIVAGDWVIDLGANQGYFTCDMLDRGCRVLAIEPTPSLFNRLPSQATRIHAAVSGSSGSCRFQVEQDPTASRVSERGIEIPLMGPASTLAHCEGGRVALMKVDIEGQEIAFLDAMTDEQVRLVDQFTIEFHSSHGLISADDVTRVLARFREIGYYVLDLTTCHMDVWVTAHPPSRLAIAYLKWLRAQRGFIRRARTKFRI